MAGTDFFFVTIIDKHLLAHVSLQRTPLTRAGGRVEVVASLSQGRTAVAQCGLFTHKSVPVIFEPPSIFLCSIENDPCLVGVIKIGFEVTVPKSQMVLSSFCDWAIPRPRICTSLQKRLRSRKTGGSPPHWPAGEDVAENGRRKGRLADRYRFPCLHRINSPRIQRNICRVRNHTDFSTVRVRHFAKC